MEKESKKSDQNIENNIAEHLQKYLQFYKANPIHCDQNLIDLGGSRWKILILKNLRLLALEAFQNTTTKNKFLTESQKEKGIFSIKLNTNLKKKDKTPFNLWANIDILKNNKKIPYPFKKKYFMQQAVTEFTEEIQEYFNIEKNNHNGFFKNYKKVEDYIEAIALMHDIISLKDPNNSSKNIYYTLKNYITANSDIIGSFKDILREQTNEIQNTFKDNLPSLDDLRLQLKKIKEEKEKKKLEETQKKIQNQFINVLQNIEEQLNIN
tara:strand:+ start:50 stop:847 length:798 start_codon:yes stop_codon:yes gene_type:complete